MPSDADVQADNKIAARHGLIEIARSTETQLRQKLAIEGLNAKYRVLRTAITGR